MVVAPELLSGLNAKQLRELARDLIAQIANRDQAISARELRISERELQISERDQQIASLGQTITSKDREIVYRQAKIDQLTHEMAVLKRWKFGRSREQLDAAQASLLDETIDADIAAIEQELQGLAPPPAPAKEPRQQPKRAALPPELPRVDLHHEPDSTTCACGCQRRCVWLVPRGAGPPIQGDICAVPKQPTSAARARLELRPKRAVDPAGCDRVRSPVAA